MPNFTHIFQLRIALGYNYFMYGLQKIPLLGRLIPDSVFKAKTIKTFMTFMALLFFILKQVFKKVNYFFWVFGISLVLAKPLSYLSISEEGSFLLLLMMTSLGLGTIIKNVDLYTPSQEAALCIKIYGMDGKSYYKSLFLFQDLPEFFFFALGLSIALKLIGLNPIGGLYFTILALGLRQLVRYGMLRSLAKKEVADLEENTGSLLLKGSLGSLVFYGLVIFIHWLTKSPVENFFYSLPALLLGLVFLVSAYWGQYQGEILNQVSQKTLTAKMSKNGTEADAVKIAMELDDKDLNLSQEEEFKDLHGVEYLNEIFYHRLSKKFFKMVRTRLIILSILVLVGLAAIVYFQETILASIKKDQVDINTALLQFAPAVIIYGSSILYVSSEVVRLSFYHLDRTLMGDPLYRSPKLVVYTLKVRLKKILKMNLPLILLVYAFTLALKGILPMISWETIGILVAWESLLMVFFSLHYLYMYYILQPFNVDLKVKNPIFMLIEAVIAIFSYQSMSIFSDIDNPMPFYIGIAGILVGFLVLGYFAVLRLAPKNFKLKH